MRQVRNFKNSKHTFMTTKVYPVVRKPHVERPKIKFAHSLELAHVSAILSAEYLLKYQQATNDRHTLMEATYTMVQWAIEFTALTECVSWEAILFEEAELPAPLNNATMIGHKVTGWDDAIIAFGELKLNNLNN
jgi:hypothetical protein